MSLFWSQKKTSETPINKGAVKVAKPTKGKATKQLSSAKVVEDKETKKETAISVPSVSLSSQSSSISNTAGVILRPRITEKSGMLSQMGVYTFEVTKLANKSSISHAIKALYKVNPVKVAIANLPARHVFVKGRRGMVAGVRKALVTLKKGDKIDFV